VLWPQGFSGHFDAASALIALAAAIALFTFKQKVIHVIGAAAIAGLLVKMLMNSLIAF
jgi:chromate transporter